MNCSIDKPSRNVPKPSCSGLHMTLSWWAEGFNLLHSKFCGKSSNCCLPLNRLNYLMCLSLDEDTMQENNNYVTFNQTLVAKEISVRFVLTIN